MKHLAIKIRSQIADCFRSFAQIQHLATLLKGHLWDFTDLYFVEDDFTIDNSAISEHPRKPTRRRLHFTESKMGLSDHAADTGSDGWETEARNFRRMCWKNADPIDWIDAASCTVPRIHHVLGVTNEGESRLKR